MFCHLNLRLNMQGLRVDSGWRSWKETDVAYVGQFENPLDRSLYAEAEAAVDDAAVLSQVQIPLIVLWIQVELFEALNKLVVVVYPLSSAGDLAVTVGSHEVCRKGQLWIVWTRLMVEGFAFPGIELYEERRLELLA